MAAFMASVSQKSSALEAFTLSLSVTAEVGEGCQSNRPLEPASSLPLILGRIMGWQLEYCDLFCLTQALVNCGLKKMVLKRALKVLCHKTDKATSDYSSKDKIKTRVQSNING